MSDYSLHKTERVRSQKAIESLFSGKSRSLVSHSFRFSWIDVPLAEAPCAVLFISSKKKQKKAVDRNRRKRILRELYRLNKIPLLTYLTDSGRNIALSLNYVGVEPLIFTLHQPLFIKAIQKLIIELQKHHTSSLPAAH